MNAFSNVDSNSESDDDKDDEDKKLLETIEAQVESRRSIDRAEKAKSSDEVWQVPKKTTK